ncbi:MAG: hypothetical protein A2V66_15230 [Ignavibacteria bacterium RBG_13_36_8]|nr:MAG: hypothetical protein A2V66_15230 [Ignavibacteria bacterium RBG_13_36_8]
MQLSQPVFLFYQFDDSIPITSCKRNSEFFLYIVIREAEPSIYRFASTDVYTAEEYYVFCHDNLYPLVYPAASLRGLFTY